MKKKLLTCVSFCVLLGQGVSSGQWIVHDGPATSSKMIQYLNELKKWKEQHEDLADKLGLQTSLLEFEKALNGKIGDPMDSAHKIDVAQRLMKALENLPKIENGDMLTKSAKGVLAITRETEVYKPLAIEKMGVAVKRNEDAYRVHAAFGRRFDQYELERDYSASWQKEATNHLKDVAHGAVLTKTTTEFWNRKIELALLRSEQKVMSLRRRIRFNDMKLQALLNLDSERRRLLITNDTGASIMGAALTNSADRSGYSQGDASLYSEGSEFIAPSIVSGEGYADPRTGVRLSETGVTLIIDHEIGGQSYYNRSLKTPTYPGGASGVTIGIGYDLGYNSPAQIRQDWGGLIDPGTLERLVGCSGLKRGSASSKVASVRDIQISFEAAAAVFHKHTLPRFCRNAQKAFPTMENLHEHSQSALVSLVFNRGSSVSGERRREMRWIRENILGGEVGQVPDHFRAMKRLWEGKGLDGLLRRRDDEANLFEVGIRS